MNPEQVDRVFGRGRLKMVTGEHVEVFREAVVHGERRRYTKRFLNSTDGDFAHWTEREWKILARLIGHGIGCVPDVVQFDRGSAKGPQLVQTYDAGVTVDQWATLLPLYRDGRVYRHAFEDCAHWWALSHYCLKALKDIHELNLVHLDIKGDNVCIPFGPATFDPEETDAPLFPLFGQLALIDFAFSLVSGENLTVALPIGWQREYDYQSPRLIEALGEGHDGNLSKTRELDWRCDFYSLAAMLKRYLPGEIAAQPKGQALGWTRERYDAAKALILSLRRHHDAELPIKLPHESLIDAAGKMLVEGDLAQSLAAGWTLARDVTVASGAASPLTPMTRIAPPVRVFRNPRERGKEAPLEKRTPALAFAAPTDLRMVRIQRRDGIPLLITRRRDAGPPEPPRSARAAIAAATITALALGAAVAHQLFPEATKNAMTSARGWFDKDERAANPPAAAEEAPAPSLASADTGAKTEASDSKAATSPAPAQTEERTGDAADGGTAEPAEAIAPASTPATDPAPSTSRPTPRAAAPASEAPPRTTAKRPATKPSQAPPPRPSPSVASASTAAKPPPNRYAPSPPRSTAGKAAANHPSAGSSVASAEGVRVETAPAPPVHVIELAPATNSLSQPEAPPASASPTEKPAAAASANATADASRAPASKSSTPRRSRPLAADEEWRAGINAVAQFFGFTKRKSAPIEDRGFQEVAPSAKASRAPQASAPAQDRAAIAPPKPDVQMLATPPAVVSTAPRLDLPPEPMRETDYASEARRALMQSVPRIAQQTQGEIAPVLWAAAKAQDPRSERDVIDAAHAVPVRNGGAMYQQPSESAAARRLNEEAMRAYWVRRNIPEAFDLSLRAFGANPNDPEVVGNLAFLHLRMTPSQPETARQLALQALSVRGTRFRSGRLEDWNTYALASALTGRDVDARNAMYVTVALAGSVERNCKAGLTAMANYGERVREPVEAMLYRIHSQGRAYDSPYCAWPPNWAAIGMRRQ